MIRTITLKRDGQCAKCGHPLHAGGRARWTPGRDGGKVWCLSNGHHGHLTNSEYRTQRQMAHNQIAWDHANNRITAEEASRRLAALEDKA